MNEQHIKKPGLRFPSIKTRCIASQQIPQLRFPEFGGEWEEKKLGEISSGVMYGMNAAAKEYDGVHKYIRITDIDESSREFCPNPLSSPDEKPDKRYKLKTGDIVFARTGASVGKSYLYKEEDGDLYFAGFLIRFTINKANPFFVYTQTLLRPYDKWVKIMSMRSGQPGVNAEEYKTLNLAFPTLPEQQKIASFFTAIDRRISQLKRKKTLLEQYKKGVMQGIFCLNYDSPDWYDEHDEKDLKSGQSHKSGKSRFRLRFKDDNGQEFPKWEKKRLGELTYKTGKKNKDSTPYPIYSINNREGFLPQGDQFEGVDSNSRGYDISLYKIIEEKTFAYNPARINVGSIGFSGDLRDIIISSLYVCFKTKQGLEDAYLLHYLKTFQFNKSVLQNVEGGVRDYLFYENFSNIKIILPSNKEQLKIANFLSAIDDKINHTQKQIEKAEVWKKGLMQQMFV